MYILYISIVLVVLGFVFILTSVEKTKKTVILKDDEPEYVPVRETSKDSAVQTPADATTQSEPVSMMKDNAAASDQTVPASGEMYEVVVYNDESGITVDHGEIDPSTLKNLSREGRGTADVTSDAVTVRIEKKLFRFDYYRLDRVSGQNDCVVLSVKGARSAFIMISEQSGFYDKVFSEFSRFRG